MIVLSQSKSFDSCDELPTITNLMSAKCDARWKTNTLTEATSPICARCIK